MTVDELENYITEYGNDIYRFCNHLSGNKELADDLYQECFLVAMQKKDSINTPLEKSYFLSIATNLWKNHWRKHKRRQEIAGSVEYDGNTLPEDSFLEQTKEKDILELYVAGETKELLLKAISKLPNRYKPIIIMYYGEDMSTVEIAKALHISKGTVTSRLSRAREIIRTNMEDLGYEK